MIGKTILGGGKTQSTSTNKDYVGGCCKDSYEIENNFISETNNIVVQGDLVVVKTIQELRDLDSESIAKLEDGSYKGVQVLGYYEEGDTPSPIIYYLSETESEDDGGSVIEVGDVKFFHDFKGAVLFDTYYGYKKEHTFTPEENTVKLNSMYSTYTGEIHHTSGVVANVNSTINIKNSNSIIYGNEFTIRQSDNSGMILSDSPLIKVTGDNNVIEGFVLDDNVENNFINYPEGKYHAIGAGIVPDVSKIGHDVVYIQADGTVFQYNKIVGSSWTAIKVSYKEDGVTRVKGTIIQDNEIIDTYRDSISVMNCEDTIIRNNKVKLFNHHQIHAYYDAYNTLIEGNECYNDKTQVFKWYPSFNINTSELSSILVDHVVYTIKTVDTTIKNNIVHGKVLGDINNGIVTQGYPVNVKINNNVIKKAVVGIFMTRGLPTGDLSIVEGNLITESSDGIHISPATTGSNYGGKTTPQASNIIVKNNNIKVSRYACRTSGDPSNINAFYNSFKTTFNNNNIIEGVLTYTFLQEINFLGSGGGSYEVVWKDNKEGLSPKFSNLQSIKNYNKGNSLVFIDTYYKYNQEDLAIVRNTLVDRYYKLLTIIMSDVNTLVCGEILVVDERQSLDKAKIHFFAKGLTRFESVMEQLVHTNTTPNNNLNTDSLIWVKTDNTTSVKFDLYVKSNRSDRDYHVYTDKILSNSNVLNLDVNTYKNPIGEVNLPSNPNNSLVNISKVGYNTAINVPLISKPDSTTLPISTAETLPSLLIDLNSLINKYNTEIVPLINDLKSTTNNSLITEIGSGLRRSF